MEILNHLEDLSDYGIEYTEEDKRIFTELEDSIKEAGYNIQYMNTPIDIIENNTITAISIKFNPDCKSGKDIFDDLIKDIKDYSKYKFINDNTLFIYKMGKLKVIKDDITTFTYTTRIGHTNLNA